jgi:hypothetical protein
MTPQLIYSIIGFILIIFALVQRWGFQRRISSIFVWLPVIMGIALLTASIVIQLRR